MVAPIRKSGRIHIDDIWIESLSDKAPYATGDAKKDGGAKTNLGIYGSSYVGIFGGIIKKTNIEVSSGLTVSRQTSIVARRIRLICITILFRKSRESLSNLGQNKRYLRINQQ